MKVKKPKLDSAGYGYLGHFAKEKFLSQGHNGSGEVSMGAVKPPKLATKLPTERKGEAERLANSRNFMQTLRENPKGKSGLLEKAAIKFFEQRGLNVGKDGGFDLNSALRIAEKEFNFPPGTIGESFNATSKPAVAETLRGDFVPGVRGQPNKIRVREGLGPRTALTIMHEAMHARDLQMIKDAYAGVPPENITPQGRKLIADVLSQRRHFLDSPPPGQSDANDEANIVQRANYGDMSTSPIGMTPSPGIDITGPDSANQYLMDKLSGGGLPPEDEQLP